MTTPVLYYTHFENEPTFHLCAKRYAENSDWWENNNVSYPFPAMIYTDQANFNLLSNVLAQAGITLLRD